MTLSALPIARTAVRSELVRYKVEVSHCIISFLVAGGRDHQSTQHHHVQWVNQPIDLQVHTARGVGVCERTRSGRAEKMAKVKE